MFVFFGLVAVVGTAYLQTAPARGAVLGRGDAGRRAGDRDPRGQQPARHPDRSRRRQADARGDARRARGRRREYAVLLGVAFVVPVAVLAVAARVGRRTLAAAAVAAARRPARCGPCAGSATGAQLNPVLQGDGAPRARVRAAVRHRAGAGRCVTARPLALRADRVAVPFRRPFPTAAGMWIAREAWLLCLTDADGRGRGRARPSSSPPTARLPATVLEALVREAVAEAMRGRLPTTAELEAHGRPGRALRAALDAARLDLEGSPRRDPARTGRASASTRRCRMLGPRASAEAASQAVAAGFGRSSSRRGAERETEVLVDRVRAVREAVGPRRRGSVST